MSRIIYNTPTLISVLVGIFLLSLTSCSTYLGPANFANEGMVYQKPMQKGDTLIKASYIKGSFFKGLTSNDDVSTFGSISLNKSYTKKKMVYAFGGYIHVGNLEIKDKIFDINDSSKEFGFSREVLVIDDKNFYGGGISGEVAFTIPFKKIDWRIVGVKLSFQYEDGSYARLRKRLERLDIFEDPDPLPFQGSDEFIDLAPNKISFNASGISELVFRINEKSDLGLWGSMGVGNQLFTTATGVYFSYNKIIGIGSCHASVSQGLLLSLGVSYKL